MNEIKTNNLNANFIENNNLIINADDFGKDKLINEAIVYCLNNNLINSTSLMVGEPGFQEAISSINNFGYKNIGLHVNLTEGKPLSTFEADCFLQENGDWDPNKVWSPNLLKKEISKKFEAEIVFQLEKMADSILFPNHINSHHHIHTTPFLFPVFLKVALKFKIKLRLCQSYYENSYFKYYYRVGINQIIKSNRLAFSDSFESLNSWNSRKQMLRAKKIEIMVHPMFLQDYSKIIDSWENVDLIEQLCFE
ncbi:putative glycoside hydrolase/deacetylase ChbG (UPF0249 family) [Algoriphagus ratkowskyi]|uniref:ChbG/HpnK family deacetylase n=1 Tax=Algoriphagus ratkowskyi TaxID=57028 RepID=A0A2W7SKP3_9BACT|nr:ChbG/HpnK family deacetylase [Algoriphagus ratkowskyi]PZX51292.1 putative glycoside hydrolase/deacetylase ChbG (UPF0249 family) [Algoriphagus ratkowskyi]TXD75918.1 ChbG/HpnK family deacetylase [Algoriphagus ratkowskyi]